MKDHSDTKTADLFEDSDPMKINEAFSLDDDAPLVCPRDQSGDKPCESCQ